MRDNPAAAGQPDEHLLWQALQSFAQIQSCPSGDETRKRLTELQVQVQATGLHGEFAFDVLKRAQKELRWEAMDSNNFGIFYKFAYWICRDFGKRNLPVERAVAAWEILLNGRFRLLDRLVAFVREQTQLLTISEDTWRQVLDFTWSVLGDLSNYDPAGAWPVLLDEFVESVRRKGRLSASRSGPYDVVFGDRAESHSSEMFGVTPSSGSKRRSVDVDCVASRLAQMPLGLRLAEGAAGEESAAAEDAKAAALLCGAAKRLRLDPAVPGSRADDPAGTPCRGLRNAGSPSRGMQGSLGHCGPPSPPRGHSLSLSPSPAVSPGHHQHLATAAPGTSPPPRWRAPPSTSATSSMSSGNSGVEAMMSPSRGGSPPCSSPFRQRHLSGVGLLQLPRGPNDSAMVSEIRDDALSHLSNIHQILHATVMDGLGLEE